MINNNVPEYTVSEFNDIFSETVRTAFGLVKIRGEISNLKIHYSGHMYFNLKDDQSIINAVCWRTNVSKLSIEPEEGMEIIATGKISTYAKSISVYQLNIESIAIAGEGALLKLIEERKKRLEKKGFFDTSKKKSLPFIPKSIGIITSPTGAVLKDIIHRIKERFPCSIQLWPTPVQGKEAANKIIEAIKAFNDISFDFPPDVIIIARGGGSIEDLMPFNDEKLATIVFESKIPIVSAIGHETDTTIIDFVSDLRAPTPSAAAEKCVPVRKDLNNMITSVVNNLNFAVKQIIFNNEEKLNSFSRLLQEPTNIINIFKSQLTNLIDKKHYLMNHLLKNYRNNIYNLSRLLKSASIEKTLKRGYAIVRKNKLIITKSKNLSKRDNIKIQFFDDQVSAEIKKT